MSLLSLIPWGQVVKLAVDLISRAINHSDELRHLEEDWVKFTKSLNKSIPVNFSNRQIVAIKILEERERIESVKAKALEEKIDNYKEKNRELYSENLKLKDKALISDSIAREL
jgi:hypothetical protein